MVVNYYHVVAASMMFATVPGLMLEMSMVFMGRLKGMRGLLIFGWALFAFGLGFLLILKEDRVMHLFSHLFR